VAIGKRTLSRTRTLHSAWHELTMLLNVQWPPLFTKKARKAACPLASTKMISQ